MADLAFPLSLDCCLLQLLNVQTVFSLAQTCETAEIGELCACHPCLSNASCCSFGDNGEVISSLRPVLTALRQSMCPSSIRPSPSLSIHEVSHSGKDKSV